MSRIYLDVEKSHEQSDKKEYQVSITKGGRIDYNDILFFETMSLDELKRLKELFANLEIE